MHSNCRLAGTPIQLLWRVEALQGVNGTLARRDIHLVCHCRPKHSPCHGDALASLLLRSDEVTAQLESIAQALRRVVAADEAAATIGAATAVASQPPPPPADENCTPFAAMPPGSGAMDMDVDGGADVLAAAAAVPVPDDDASDVSDSATAAAAALAALDGAPPADVRATAVAEAEIEAAAAAYDAHHVPAAAGAAVVAAAGAALEAARPKDQGRGHRSGKRWGRVGRFGCEVASPDENKSSTPTRKKNV